MRNPNRASTMKALKRFEIACFEEAWKGSGDPSNFKTIEDEYLEAKRIMLETIEALTERG